MLRKTNLSTFLVLITRSWREVFNNGGYFNALEKFFPAAFPSRFSVAKDLGAAMEVRIRHLIMLLTRYSDEPNFDCRSAEMKN